MSDPVPAVTEAEATGEIAALYADIRGALGVSVVNLIWRHLATIPGALPWAWGTVRPLYLDGSAAASAERFRAELDLPALSRLPEEVLRAAGIDAAAEAGIRAVLASYDRSNATNLLTLSALLAALDGDAGLPETPAAAPEAMQPVEGPLPRLLAAAEMAPATAALVSRLNLIGERDQGRIVASMYRHLAHWPAFLALTWALVAPLHAGGRLVPAIEANLREARRVARTLVPRLAAPPALAAGEREAARTAIAVFAEHPIGKMVTICRLLGRALGRPGTA